MDGIPKCPDLSGHKELCECTNSARLCEDLKTRVNILDSTLNFTGNHFKEIKIGVRC